MGGLCGWIRGPQATGDQRLRWLASELNYIGSPFEPRLVGSSPKHLLQEGITRCKTQVPGRCRCGRAVPAFAPHVVAAPTSAGSSPQGGQANGLPRPVLPTPSRSVAFQAGSALSASPPWLVPAHLCPERPSREGLLAQGGCGRLCLGMVVSPCTSALVLTALSPHPPPCPGPEPVAQLQRAPAASTRHEISPDCHFFTPGPEQHQVRPCAPVASLLASVPARPSSAGSVPGNHPGCGGVGRQLLLWSRWLPPLPATASGSASGPAALRPARDRPLVAPSRRKARGEAKKCRKVYGIEHRDQWCTACRWKKACQRFLD